MDIIISNIDDRDKKAGQNKNEAVTYFNAETFWNLINSSSFTLDLLNNFYYIDCSCKYKEGILLQNFGGIQIYRKLLQIYNDKEESLPGPFNVALYSILSKEQIISLREDFEILLNPDLQFVQLCSKSSFKSKIASIRQHFTNPNHSIAADNLLRGYNLFEARKITVPYNRKLLIIDDFYYEYELVYKRIFAKYDVSIVTPDLKILVEWRENKTDENKLRVLENIEEIIEECKPDFVLSDFYIAERHKDNKHIRSVNDLVDISGYIVFKHIKRRYPWMPYMFYTTSNKIWNYDVLRKEGIWYWVVKDTRVDLPKSYLIEYYNVFKDTLTKLMNEEWQFACDSWEKLNNLKENKTWNPGILPNHTARPMVRDKSIMLDEIYQAVFGSLKLLEKLYVDIEYYSTKNDDLQGMGVASIISKLGGICERLFFHYHSLHGGSAVNNVGCTIYLLRAFATHQSFHKQLKPVEAVFLIDLLVECLSGAIVTTSNTNGEKPDDVSLIAETEFQEFSNYGYYIQFKSMVDSHNWPVNTDLLQLLLSAFININNLRSICSDPKAISRKISRIVNKLKKESNNDELKKLKNQKRRWEEIKSNRLLIENIVNDYLASNYYKNVLG